jgi:hypothetical protein
VRTAVATLRLLPRAAIQAPRALSIPPRWRLRLLVVALLAVVLAALYMFWFRDSGFVRVERVTVTGLSSADAKRIRATLTLAGQQQTTLHVDVGALRAAVKDEPIVRDLRAVPDFPHGLRIEVVENRPVAQLSAGGDTVAVAPDGTVLGGVKTDAGLPTLKVTALPTGGRLGDGATRDLVAVAGAAPLRLLPRITGIEKRRGPGMVVHLQRGPELYFGSADHLTEKWAAASSVLANRSSQGATYVDVRMFTRPVAGGLGFEDEPQPVDETAAPAVVPGAAVAPAADPQPTTATPAGTAPVDPSTAQTAPPAATQAAPATTAPPAAGTAPDPQP